MTAARVGRPPVGTGAPSEGRAATLRILLPSAGFAILLGVLLLVPVPSAPESFLTPVEEVPGFDKWVHFSLFAIGAFVWRRGLRRAGARRPGLTAATFGSAYAAALELAQGALSTGRSPDFLDFLAGAGAAVFVTALMARSPASERASRVRRS